MAARVNSPVARAAIHARLIGFVEVSEGMCTQTVYPLGLRLQMWLTDADDILVSGDN